MTSLPKRTAITLGVVGLMAITMPLLLPLTSFAAQAQQISDETLAMGQFQGADRSHRGSGTARIVRLANGETEVRLEGFSVTGGPDLRVWVTDTATISNARAARRANHVDLGRLQRNRGDQSYTIPADALDGNHRSVVIWCRAFGVLFASAPLS